MARKFNTWYSVKDGNFSDPTVWMSNGAKKHSYPQAGDDVYISHNVTIEGSIKNSYSVGNIYVSGTLVFSNIAGNITLTVTGDLQIAGTLDMSEANSSNLILNGVNNYVVNFPTPGVGTTITYERLGDQDLMPLAYANLALTGTGNKNINVSLTVNYTTNVSGPVLLNKSSSNKLTFIGSFTGIGLLPTTCYLDNTVNADIEFRGGISYDVRNFALLSGTGNMYFNGTQTINIGGQSPYNNYNNILIQGTSVVTIAPGNTPFVINGSINGSTSSSTLNVSGILWQATNTEPMATGIYNYNFGGTSIIGYVFNGNYTLPYAAYHGLQINGTGIKTLSAATTLTGNLSLDAGGALELSTFDFTVTGTTTYGSSASITKNGASGYTTLTGVVTISNTSTASVFSFNQPCTVEFQNGLFFDISQFIPVFVTGVTLKFTTNNQAIDSGHGASAFWGCNILISGAITLTNQNWGIGISGTLNGDNAASTFNNIVSFNYQNNQQPMQTGILSSNNSGSKNAFIYGLSSPQDITGGNYYNLILQGSSAKRLLGNVSVKGTYTLTSPATLNTNGFALTNP